MNDMPKFAAAAFAALFIVGEAHAMRWYSPNTGRWFSRDPIGERGGNNLYGFNANSPLSRVDALGLEPWPGWPGGPWGPGVGSCPCKCLSVDVTYDPGGNSLALGPYTDWLNHKFGNRVRVRWRVSGNPWQCRYFQDEKGTRSVLTRTAPTPGSTTADGVDGTAVRQVYTDYAGADFGIASGFGLDGTYTLTVHWDVTFRCESAPGSGGGRVTRHDVSDASATFTVPWW